MLGAVNRVEVKAEAKGEGFRGEVAREGVRGGVEGAAGSVKKAKVEDGGVRAGCCGEGGERGLVEIRSAGAAGADKIGGCCCCCGGCCGGAAVRGDAACAASSEVSLSPSGCSMVVGQGDCGLAAAGDDGNPALTGELDIPLPAPVAG
eukprot:scaffold270006_cov19-Tisochrysis_lutea.AAC.2